MLTADFAARYYHSGPARVDYLYWVIPGKLFGVKLTRNALLVEVNSRWPEVRLEEMWSDLLEATFSVVCNG